MTQSIAVRDQAPHRACMHPVWTPPAGVPVARVAEVVGSFLDLAATFHGKATHYNSAAELSAAEASIHQALLELDRGLYAALLTVPGATDRSHLHGVRALLASTPTGAGLMSVDGERALLYRLVATLPPQRMLKLFAALGDGDGGRAVNHARARKLVLRTLLGARKLELWTVKYRGKLRRALTHALGVRTAGILRAILSKQAADRTAKDDKILAEELGRYCRDRRRESVYECVGFALGARPERYTVASLQAFAAAKRDLSAGRGLPLEVLEGIRSHYHKEVAPAAVIELCKDAMSRGQRLAVQRKAKAADIEVTVDPTLYDAVKLYLYALEMGVDDAIAQALDDKARRSAAGFPMRYRKVGILVDASRSMAGDHSQQHRPLATVLALRDMLMHTADEAEVRYAGGRAEGRLVRPEGETGLVGALLDLVRAMPDVVYVLSDGYENAPAGRFAEVVAALDECGVRVPIHHLNPVMAAEAGGVRALAPGRVPSIPVRGPDGLGLSVLRHLITIDPVRAINALLGVTTFAPKELLP
ncbi:VWA domain-containing protein [Haliangium sp.]|uniref:VWA domain-containing protein n=1 Tax=Haliangium sp. TaxID=2663208 RepID=UPI003D09904E